MAENEINLTPNFDLLFTRFLQDARNEGMNLSASLCSVRLQDYPKTPEDLFRLQMGLLRAVQAFLAPANVALQCATTVDAIHQLREIMCDVVAKFDADIATLESKREE